jgi:hypothetical protein
MFGGCEKDLDILRMETAEFAEFEGFICCCSCRNDNKIFLLIKIFLEIYFQLCLLD